MWRSLAVAGVALALAPAALAKGPVEACGASGCATVAPEDGTSSPLFAALGRTGTPAPVAPAPFFVLRFRDVPNAPLAYWIPSESTLRFAQQQGRGSWIPTLAPDDALLRSATAGLAPSPVPSGLSVAVGARAAKGGASYLRLFTLGTPTTLPHGWNPARWTTIWVMGPPSPWTDGATDLRISRRGSLLWRNGEVLRIPADVAARIRARQPLS